MKPRGSWPDMPEKRYESVYDDARLEQELAPGASVIRDLIGTLIWTKAKLRKDNSCARCQKKLAKGLEAYRPITNGDRRPDRLCPECVAAISKERA